MDDHRKSERRNLDEDLMFACRTSHPYCYYGASAVDCSPGGMRLISRYEAAPGEKLCLRMIGRHLKSFDSLHELTCMAEVKWCRPIATVDEPAFEIGIKYHGDQVPSVFTPWNP